MNASQSQLRHALPPDRIPFSELTSLLGISRATLQRTYRPGSANPAKHKEWAERLDIRKHKIATRGKALFMLHCSRHRCNELARELRGEYLADALAL